MTISPSLPLVLIEAFATQPHQGNGATVVALEAPADPAWMQAVAAGLRQSETAFVVPWGEGWAIRWFTPSCEVDLCGHATLAATLALRHWGSLLPGEATVFQSRSGPLAVSLPAESDAGGSAIAAIDLPSGSLQPSAPPEGLEPLLQRRLGVGAQHCWDSALGYRVALVAPEADLGALDGLAAELPLACQRGLVVMQALDRQAPPDSPTVAGERPDYQLRFFAPGLGIPEDPVTGSAHALVAPYWLDRLQRPTVRGWQCSPEGGGMTCERAAPGTIRLTGPGQLLVEGRVAWREQICDPERWSALFPAGERR